MRHCCVLQRLVSAVLDSSVKDWSLKEVVNLIGLLASQLQRRSSEVRSDGAVVPSGHSVASQVCWMTEPGLSVPLADVCF